MRICIILKYSRISDLMSLVIFSTIVMLTVCGKSRPVDVRKMLMNMKNQYRKSKTQIRGHNSQFRCLWFSEHESNVPRKLLIMPDYLANGNGSSADDILSLPQIPNIGGYVMYFKRRATNKSSFLKT